MDGSCNVALYGRSSRFSAILEADLSSSPNLGSDSPELPPTCVVSPVQSASSKDTTAALPAANLQPSEEPASSLGKTAENLMETGRAPEALIILTSALRQGEDCDLWSDWSCAAAACGDLDLAEQGCRRALDLDASHHQAAVNLASILATQGRFEELQPVLEKIASSLTDAEKQAMRQLVLGRRAASASSETNFGRYNQEFYETGKNGSRASARVILGEMFKLLGAAPARVADIGCGLGTWLRVALELGAKSIHGFDGDWVPRANLEIDPEYFTPCDLLRPAGLPSSGIDRTDSYDLVLSMEVAEHLPPASANDFVALLCRHSDLVLFSAAAPLQGGTNHVNERWPSYWAALFRQYGFECFDPIRPLAWCRPEVEWWYAQNVLVFARRTASAQLRAKVTPVAEPLPLVHPGRLDLKTY